jgi:amino acid transporter
LLWRLAFAVILYPACAVQHKFQGKQAPTVTSPGENPTAAAPAGLTDIGRFGYEQELRRSLSTADLVIYGLIFMVPIAPFAIFGSVFSLSGGMVALAYCIGLVAMLFTANSYAQMARAFPIAGSVYSYAGRGIAKPVGFISGWAMLLDYTFVPALLYLASSLAMNATIPAVPVWVWLVGFVALNTAINFLGISLTAKINKVVIAFELIVLAIFLVIGIAAVVQGRGRGFGFSAFFDSGSFSLTMVLSATSVAALSFLGFDAVSTLAEEHKGTARQLGRSMMIALVLAGVLFIVQNWVASMLVTDPETLIAEGDSAGVAFYDAAGLAGGHWLYVLTAVALAIAWGFADAMAAQAATSRLLFAMARDRQLPSFLRKVSSNHDVPVAATSLVAVISLGFGIYLTLLPDGLTVISSLVNFGGLTGFAILNLTVVWYYIGKQKSRRWFVHLVCPLLGLVVLVFVLINARTSAQIVGLAWLALGVVLGIVLRHRGIDTTIAPAE